MKTLLKYSSFRSLVQLILLISLFISCTEVVDVDLDTSQERLVIEASIKWEKGTSGSEQVIILTRTSSYYTNKTIYASGAIVTITDENGALYTFDETVDGIYTTSLFSPEFNLEYTLNILYNNENYTSTASITAAPEIAFLLQSTEQGFSNAPEVIMVFVDDEETDNNYKTVMKNLRTEERDIFFFDDQYWEGNEGVVWFEREDMEPGDEIDCYVYGISKAYKKYGEKIWNQSNSPGGAFTTPPVNIKGNILNTTTEANYPYGYFTMSEFSNEIYTFQ